MKIDFSFIRLNTILIQLNYIVFSVLLCFTDSDNPFGIFKFFLYFRFLLYFYLGYMSVNF